MKILYLTTILLPSEDAQSIQVAAMAKAFSKELGDDFLLVSPSDRENRDLAVGWRWRRLRVPSLSRVVRYFWMIISSLPIVIKFRPTVIYSRDIGVIFIYRLLGYKCAYEIHKPFETVCGKAAFRLIANYISVIAISEALKSFVSKVYGVKLTHVLAAHDGVWLEDFLSLNRLKCRAELVAKLCLSPDAFIALYSGNLKVGGKGLDLICQAARNCPEVTFVMVGGNPDLSEKPKNLLFVPRVSVETIPSYLVAANVLLLPFTKELKTWQYHSALKMFEYMASGVPVIASRLGSIGEVLNDENAILFDLEVENDMVNKIKWVANNYNLVTARSKVASEEVKKYEWTCRAKNIVKFLSL